MGKIVDKTEIKIVTLDGVEIIKQVTKVLMPNGKYRYPTVYFTVNDDVKALTTEQLDNSVFTGVKSKSSYPRSTAIATSSKGTG